MTKLVAQNRRARFDYDILETVDAGMVLTGQEVKSCRAGHVNLAGSYVSFLGGKPLLKNATISKYSFAGNLLDYDPKRDRPLLLKATETRRLEASITEKGIAVIPLEMRAGRFVKLTLGVARGRKKIDKRAKIREREMGRKIREGREI